MLRDVQGLSYDDIAKVMGVNRGTVMSRLHYARKHLQRLLLQMGVLLKREESSNKDLNDSAGRTSNERVLKGGKASVRGITASGRRLASSSGSSRVEPRM